MFAICIVFVIAIAIYIVIVELIKKKIDDDKQEIFEVVTSEIIPCIVFAIFIIKILYENW